MEKSPDFEHSNSVLPERCDNEWKPPSGNLANARGLLPSIGTVTNLPVAELQATKLEPNLWD